MLIAKKELNEWTHVILDEVHEREEDMDLVDDTVNDDAPTSLSDTFTVSNHASKQA